MMSGIRGKNTKPEMIVRQELFKRGFRYRIHRKDLPGKPDLVFPMYNAAIFVNGCFWHGHDCKLFKWPKQNQEFWKDKIIGNRNRDQKNVNLLSGQGWRVLTIWECAFRGKRIDDITVEIDKVVEWLVSADNEIERAPIKTQRK